MSKNHRVTDMIIHYFILESNPFFDAYWQSDFLGKAIFLSLIGLSIYSWALLIYKYLLTKKATEASLEFKKIFKSHKLTPLKIDAAQVPGTVKNPFLEIYTVLKRYTLDILNKNRSFCKEEGSSFLSHSDIDFVESHIASTITDQTKYLEKDLYLLRTVVTLSPFLGLLGTVWGILTAFSEMQVHTSGSTNQMVLAGLSLALTTTVLGLVNAIPALIGYNYLTQNVRNMQLDMQSFSNEVLSSIELQYRQVDIR